MMLPSSAGRWMRWVAIERGFSYQAHLWTCDEYLQLVWKLCVVVCRVFGLREGDLGMTDGPKDLAIKGSRPLSLALDGHPG